jgi:hypothetical protein
MPPPRSIRTGFATPQPRSKPALRPAVAARRLVAMSGPFQLPSAGGGEGAPGKRKRQNFGTVPKCGECATCLRPTLKKSCLRNRPPQAQGAGGSGFYASAAARLQPPQPSVLESLPRPDQEKPAVPRGVAGFRLPIAPQQRARKWSRQWCVRCAAHTALSVALTLACACRVPQEALEPGDPPCWALRWMPGACASQPSLVRCAEPRDTRRGCRC